MVAYHRGHFGWNKKVFGENPSNLMQVYGSCWEISLEYWVHEVWVGAYHDPCTISWSSKEDFFFFGEGEIKTTIPFPSHSHPAVVTVALSAAGRFHKRGYLLVSSLLGFVGLGILGLFSQGSGILQQFRWMFFFLKNYFPQMFSRITTYQN